MSYISTDQTKNFFYSERNA